MKIELSQYNHGECPYLDNRSWVVQAFFTQYLAPGAFDQLLNDGFRRSGHFFYQNNCPGCEDCIPIRVIAAEFKPSRSQKRVLKKNQDLEVIRKRPQFSFEVFELYEYYSKEWHQEEEILSEEGFRQFLILSAVDSWMMEYRLDGKLIGCGWVDLTSSSLSSVYFIFNPEFKNRSLGTFSVLKELEWCREIDLKWLHLGFWVQKNQKMSYKSQFNPHEKRIKGEWRNNS